MTTNLGDGLLALAVTAILAPLVLAQLRRRRLLDIPSSRSSHSEPVPRGGGLAPLVGMLTALAVSTTITGSSRAGLVAAVATFGVIGLAEDLLWGIHPLVRLALQVVASLVAL